MNMLTVEIGTVIALLLSAYSIFIAKKRHDSTDLKELTKLLTTLSTKLETIENAVLGKPTLSEQVAVITRENVEHERRITALEQKCEEVRFS